VKDKGQEHMYALINSSCFRIFILVVVSVDSQLFQELEVGSNYIVYINIGFLLLSVGRKTHRSQ
jgi:hypothetical protein